MRHPFGWCGGGDHKRCRRSYLTLYKVLRMCGCDRHGCPCAVMNHHFPVEVHEEELPDKDVQAQ